MYQWECVAFSERRGDIARWIIAVIAGFLLPSLFLVFGDIAFNSTEFWGFISFGLAGMSAGRYLLMPDHRYCYSLTQAGVHYTDQEVIPDAAYTFVRGFAWVGIAVCLLALAVVGPLAFVGAGGFALLAFGLTNFRPTVKHEDVYFAEQLILFDPIKEKMLILNTELLRDPRFIGTLFFSSFDEKNHVMGLIKNVHNNVDYCPLQRVNDQSKHRKYQQALKEE
ncbi:putative membrane protein [Vibrio cholerae]|nr:putative membrane protein [Vibrio cholerae]